MCGRFTLTTDDRAWLSAELGVPDDLLDEISDRLVPRFNIAPSQPHWVVREAGEDRVPLPATWGLPIGPSGAGSVRRAINVRGEDVESRTTSRDAFRARRCAVPADGFFEWAGGPARRRRPFWFHRPDHGLLRLAALYAEPVGGPVDGAATFAILTTAASDDVAPVHDRMPVLLPDDDAMEAWLSARQPLEAVRRMLAPAPRGHLMRRAVSSRVNAVAHDDASCLDEVEDAVQPTLFRR